MKGAEKGGCSSSPLMKLEARCLLKGKRLSPISTYGTSSLAMSTSRDFVKCRQRILFLVAGIAKFVKVVS